MKIIIFVTTPYFSIIVTIVKILQDFFEFSKNGQKKCPKTEIENTFGRPKT
jgi:hypothetical protein